MHMITVLRTQAQHIYDQALWELLHRERADIGQARRVAEMAVFNWLWDGEFERLCNVEPLRLARLRILILSDFCSSLGTLWGKGHLQVLPTGLKREGQRFYRELGT